MIRIIDGCSTGKTKKLILLAEKHNYPIVCSNPLAMKYKASVYGVRGVDFIDYETFIYQTDTLNEPFFVDELEDFVIYWVENMTDCGCGNVNYTHQMLEEDLEALLDNKYDFLAGYTLTRDDNEI